MEGLSQNTSNIEKQEQEETQPKIKEGVYFLFEQNPELAGIGTKEQYSEYLNTIFPESKVKDIVWHGSNQKKFEEFDTEHRGMSGKNFGHGVYTFPNFYHAKEYALGENAHVIALMLDVKDPFITCNHYKDWHGAHYSLNNERFTDYVKNDSIINYEYLDRDWLKKLNNRMIEYIGEKDDRGFPVYQKNIRTNPKIKEIVVPYNNQINILGSKKDLENFKKFVEKSSLAS